MQLSLFSVSYAGYWGQDQLDVVQFIHRAASTGFTGVMLAGKRPHLSPLDADEERLTEIARALSESGVKCLALAAYNDFGVSSPAEVPFLEMQLGYIEQLSRMARGLGAQVVRVFTAYETDGQSLSLVWQRVTKALREACDRAAAHGITLAVQNHHDVAVDTNALLDLLADVDRPNCKAGFDAWSPALRGEDLYDTARRMAPLTAMTTNADYVRFPRYRYRPDVVNYDRVTPDFVRAVPFGSGFIDYSAFFAGLCEGGFQGIANYEMCSPIRGGGQIQNLDSYAKQYVSWMHEHAQPVRVK